jgi:hypothetical protein
MRIASVALTLGVLGAFIAVGSAQQEVRTTPGPGSGIMKVVGSVDIANVPSVEAGQRGEWRVAISNTPQVAIAGTPSVALSALPFVAARGQYRVTWTDGSTETVTVVEAGPGGWIRVASEDGQRWVNLSMAQAIQTQTAAR